MQRNKGCAALLVMGILMGCRQPQEVVPDAAATEPAVESSAEVEEPSVTEQPVAIEEATPQGKEFARMPPTLEDLSAFTADLGNGALYATIETNHGDLRCELHEDRAPVTVANFVGLARGLKAWSEPIFDDLTTSGVRPGKPMVDTPLYDGVLCHRVIPEFMVQCGDPSGTGRGGPGYKIPDEFSPSLTHDRPGILSMANAGPGTGGSQFFITEVATPHLNNRHTIFGHCEPLEVIETIARVPTSGANRPTKDVIIEHIEIERVK